MQSEFTQGFLLALRIPLARYIRAAVPALEHGRCVPPADARPPVGYDPDENADLRR
jgi:hypothetical protein